MKWRNCDWFAVCKQLLLLAGVYLLLLMGAMLLGEKSAAGFRPLLWPRQIAFFLLLGRLFDLIYAKAENPGKKRLLLVLIIFLLTACSLWFFRSVRIQPQNNISFAAFDRLIMVYAVFALGVKADVWDLNHYDLLTGIKYSVPVIFLLAFFRANTGMLEDLLPVYLGFLFLSLITLAIFHLENLRAGVTPRKQGEMARQWLLVAGGAALTILLGSLLAYSLYHPQYLRLIGRWLYLAYVTLAGVIEVPLQYVGILGMYAVRWLLTRFGRRLPPPVAVDDPVFTEGDTGPWALPPSVTHALHLIVNGLLIFLLAYIFWLVLRYLLKKYKGKQPDSGEETRESVFQWALVKKDLSGLLDPFKRRWQRFRQGTLLSNHAPAYRVRKVYAAVLRRAERAGKKRKAQETPSQFAPALVEVMETRSADAVYRLTRLYEAARYHPPATTQEDAEQAESCLEQLTK